METDKEITPEGTANDEAADAAREQAGDQEEGAEAGPISAAGSAPGGNVPGAPASGLGAVFGSVLGRAAQFGTVAAAYAYFLGWSFFSNALQRFHVDAEEIGVTPAWLLVRLVPIAIVMVLATGAAYVSISRGRIRSQLTGVAGGVLGGALAIAAIFGLSIALNAADHALFGESLSIPSYKSLAHIDVGLVWLWCRLALSAVIISIATAYMFLLAFDERTRRTLVSFFKEEPKSGSPPGKGKASVTKDPGIGRLLLSSSPRTNVLVLTGLLVALTSIAYESVAAAGHALGDYIVKGHSATFGPMIEWPAVLVTEHGSRQCMLELGLSQDTFVLYSWRSGSVTFLSTGDANVSVPPKGCTAKT